MHCSKLKFTFFVHCPHYCLQMNILCPQNVNNYKSYDQYYINKVFMSTKMCTIWYINVSKTYMFTLYLNMYTYCDDLSNNPKGDGLFVLQWLWTICSHVDILFLLFHCQTLCEHYVLPVYWTHIMSCRTYFWICPHWRHIQNGSSTYPK
jgi:hypothetical protein